MPAATATPPASFPSLANQFLVAMPNMLDPNFSGAVVLLCEHTENGALGMIINKPTDLTLDTLFERIEIPLHNPKLHHLPLYYGGPVQVERGFVLHSPVGKWSSSLQIAPSLGMTTSKDVLQAAAQAEGPEQILITLGYSGWGAGQLEQEIAQNAWLNLPIRHDLIFDVAPELRFVTAYQMLGVDPLQMSTQAGHA